MAGVAADLPHRLRRTRSRRTAGEDQPRYSILSKEFVGDESGKVKAVKTTQISVGADGRFEEVAGTEKEWPADLVVLAMGFRHPEATISVTLKLEADARNNVKANTADYRTSSRGASPPATAAAARASWCGRSTRRNSAAACDAYLRQRPEAARRRSRSMGRRAPAL